MSRAVANDLDPNAVNLCFCSSCLELGGERRRALMADRLGAVRRGVVANVPDADAPVGVDVERRRTRQRLWRQNNPESETARRKRSHAKEAAKREALKARKAERRADRDTLDCEAAS